MKLGNSTVRSMPSPTRCQSAWSRSHAPSSSGVRSAMSHHRPAHQCRPVGCEDDAVPEVDSSAEWFARALAVTPGGVNSPVRAFGAVGGTPRFIVRAAGPYLYDADGRDYVDLVCSWGPTILGHAHPEVVAAVRRAAGDG